MIKVFRDGQVVEMDTTPCPLGVVKLRAILAAAEHPDDPDAGIAAMEDFEEHGEKCPGCMATMAGAMLDGMRMAIARAEEGA